MSQPVPIRCYDRDAKTFGYARSSNRRCQLEGCGSERLSVTWPDGKRTYPCMRGLRSFRKYHWRIM